MLGDVEDEIDGEAEGLILALGLADGEVEPVPI